MTETMAMSLQLMRIVSRMNPEVAQLYYMAFSAWVEELPQRFPRCLLECTSLERVERVVLHGLRGIRYFHDVLVGRRWDLIDLTLPGH